MDGVDNLVPLYYEVDGERKLLGKISEISSDISDVIEPTDEYEQFIKKIKYNQEYSMTFNISNVDKEVLMKTFIEPYIRYWFQRDLMNSFIKSYMIELMKEKGMTDREIVIEEVYKKHCWKYSSRI